MDRRHPFPHSSLNVSPRMHTYICAIHLWVCKSYTQDLKTTTAKACQRVFASTGSGKWKILEKNMKVMKNGKQLNVFEYMKFKSGNGSGFWLRTLLCNGNV